MKRMMPLVLASLAVVGAWPVAAQTGADLRELDRLSRERGEARGAYLRSREGRPRAPSPGQPPFEPVRQLPGLWLCAGSESNRPVFTAPDSKAAVMGRTLPYVATRGVREGPWLEVLHSNGHLGYILFDEATDAAGHLRPYEPSEGVAARQCTVAGVRASDGTLVFRFQ
jgi:hypothetical protein